MYNLHSKDEALENFKIYKSKVKLKHDLHVKRLRINKEENSTIQAIPNPMVSFMKPSPDMHHN